MKLLIVEDDTLTAQGLVTVLSSHNYAVEVAKDGESAWNLIEAFDYDLLLLDVILPGTDGISLCRRIRDKGLEMPILLLTGRDSGHDKALGLDAGADDYVVKPFDWEELTARIRALLRRGSAIAHPLLIWGDLQLDPETSEASYAAQSLTLTPKEYALLDLFLRNGRRVFNCSTILEHLWTYEAIPGEEAVRTHIKGVRQKLKAVGAPADFIETIYGLGYRLNASLETQSKPISLPPDHHRSAESQAQIQSHLANQAHQASQANQANPTNSPQPPNASPNELQTLIMVNRVWHQFREHVSEQVSRLEQAIDDLLCKTLEPALLEQVQRDAHSLAGGLGTFGLPHASHLAHQIEVTLRHSQALGPKEGENLKLWVTALRQEITDAHNGPDNDPDYRAAPSADSALLPQTTSDDRPYLLIVDRDRPLTQQLAIAAQQAGFHAEVALTLAKARAKVALCPPHMLLLDPSTAADSQESWQFVQFLEQLSPPVSTVIFTAQDNLTGRLQAATAGGSVFLAKSLVTLPQVMATAQQMLRDRRQVANKLLIVDDDLQILTLVKALLKPLDFQVTTLADPEAFWKTLEATQPDLLILDVEMPHISGLELCQIVRNDRRWRHLPILFLTAHTDLATVNQALSYGADDFVSKPIVGPDLVTRILRRLTRIRLLQSAAVLELSV